MVDASAGFPRLILAKLILGPGALVVGWSIFKMLESLGVPWNRSFLLASTMVGSMVLGIGLVFLGRLNRFLSAGNRAPDFPLFGERPAWLGASERARGSLSVPQTTQQTQAGELSEVSPTGAVSFVEEDVTPSN